MKAKIRKTGEIVNIADTKIVLDQCDSYGNPIEMKPEDVELIQEYVEDEHWQDVRERAAISALHGMLSCAEGPFSYQGITDEIAKAAVDYADSLVVELRK